MEKQQIKLSEAARAGSVTSLHQLLSDDPLILDKAAVNCFNDTPLHVAAMLGHVDFVKKIIALKPELVNELNSDGSSPLHLASAKGHVEIVKALLRVDTRACMHRDRNQMLPLHLAAAKGRVEAMQLLLGARPEAATACGGGGGGENILHLCVKRYQLEALRVMVKSGVCSSELLNSRDGDGNTVLHLAVVEKQVETVKVLVSVGAIEVNAVNDDGITPLDVLIRSKRDVRDSEIEKSLQNTRGGFGTLDKKKKQNSASSNSNSSSSSSNDINNNSWGSLMKQHAGWLDRKKDALMVVASLIATMAFQIGVNPPGGVWQEDSLVDAKGQPVKNQHYAGDSICADKHSGAYSSFYVVNTIAFIASLSIILLLTSGLPLRRRFFMWILMVITWIAITAIAVCYLLVVSMLSPPDHSKFVQDVINYTVFAWIGLMALLLIVHTIRMIVRFLKMLFRACMCMWRCWRRSKGQTEVGRP